MLSEKQMDIDTLISAFSDLQNQAIAVPQRVGFFERRGAKPIWCIIPAKRPLNSVEQGRS